MLQEILGLMYWFIGVDDKIADLTIVQVVTRTIIVYGVGLLLIRLGKRRFLGGYTAFDILMGFVIGSIMSRTITGRENLVSASIVILTLILIHYVISYVSFHFGKASKILKNQERQLIKDGEIDLIAMETSKLGDNDLLQALRQKGGVESPEDVKAAFLERDGSITVIPKERSPSILEINVEEGVQKVVISLC